MLQIKTSVANKRFLLQITQMLQTNNERCKQKRNAAHKKGTLQIKKKKSCACTRPKGLGSSRVFPSLPSLFNLEKIFIFFFKVVVVARFHSITPSLPLQLETRGKLSYEKARADRRKI